MKTEPAKNYKYDRKTIINDVVLIVNNKLFIALLSLTQLPNILLTFYFYPEVD